MTPLWRRLLLAGFWVLPAALATLAFRWVPSRYNPSLGVDGLFLSQLCIWMPWALWSIAIGAVADRVPLDRGRWGRALLAHGALCALVLPAEMLVIDATTRAFGLVPADPGRHLSSILALGLRQYGDMLFVVYCAVVGADAAWRWHARWRDAVRREAQLGEALARAQLDALQAQLNPHFLFNALNAVVSLIDADPGRAQQMTVRIADLLRSTLASGRSAESSLEDELAFTARYLEIEQVRYGDRLAVQWDVAPGLERERVPAFALQPLVENAIRHGIAQVPGPGVIDVRVRREMAVLVLQVHDTGPGLATGPNGATGRGGAGIALDNLRHRLTHLYGSAATLVLSARAGGGTMAEIRIPSTGDFARVPVTA